MKRAKAGNLIQKRGYFRPTLILRARRSFALETMQFVTQMTHLRKCVTCRRAGLKRDGLQLAVGRLQGRRDDDVRRLRRCKEGVHFCERRAEMPRCVFDVLGVFRLTLLLLLLFSRTQVLLFTSFPLRSLAEVVVAIEIDLETVFLLNPLLLDKTVTERLDTLAESLRVRRDRMDKPHTPRNTPKSEVSAIPIREPLHNTYNQNTYLFPPQRSERLKERLDTARLKPLFRNA